MDVFYDDYLSLADEDSTFGSKSDNYLKVGMLCYMSFSSLPIGAFQWPITSSIMLTSNLN